MQRLTAQDASFLYVETPTAHMHVSFTAVFDQPEGQTLSLQALKDLVISRLDRMPVLRRRLREVPFQLHHPVWSEDTVLDLDFHVRRTVAPPPGGTEQLSEVVSELMSRPLDRDRPLWELLLVDQLAGGRLALVLKIHHSAVDGMSGMALMSILLADEPGPIPAARRPSAPVECIPDDLAMVTGSVLDLLQQPARLFKGIGDVAPSPPAGYTNGPPAPGPTPWKSPLNGSITQRRQVVFSQLPFDAVREIRKNLGGTVNDIVLTICAAALRRLIARAGLEGSPSLVALVPVSVRTEQQRTAMGNRVSGMVVPLSTDIADPIGRLQAIRRSTELAKNLHNAVPDRSLADWAVFGGPRLLTNAASLFSELRIADVAPPPYHLVISNVPGPSRHLYCGSSSMTALYPAGPLGEGMGLNITLGSYEGQLNFSLTTCPDRIPSPEIIASDLHAGLHELQAAIR